jgi:threonine dehydratase
MPRVFEVHPELAFWALNDRKALHEPKKAKGTPYGPGMALRRELLARSGLLPRRLIQAPPPRARPRTTCSMRLRG